MVLADSGRVLPLLDRTAGRDSQLMAAVYRTSVARWRTATPALRRQALALDAARFGARDLAERITAVNVAGAPGEQWRVGWATGSLVDSRFLYSIDGCQGGIRGVATVTLGSRIVALCGSNDGTLRWWDLATGSQIGECFVSHGVALTAVSAAVVNDRPLAVTGVADGTVHLWDLATDQQVGKPLTGHNGTVRCAETVIVDCCALAVTGGADGTVRVWDLAVGQQVGKPLTGHNSEVTTVATAVVGGWPVAITGGSDGTVLRWDLVAGQQTGAPLMGPTGMPTVVATAKLNAKPVAVGFTGNFVTGDALRVWDLRESEQTGQFLTSQDSNPMHAVTTTAFDGGLTVVAVDWSGGWVQIRNLATGQQTGRPLSGHIDTVWSIATAAVDNHCFVVTGGENGTVRVWDLAAPRLLSQPRVGHTSPVHTISTGVANGTQIAVTVSGSDAKTVLAWELASGRQIGTTSIDNITERPERDVAELGIPLVMITEVGKCVTVRNLVTGHQVGAPLIGHTGRVRAVTTGVLNSEPIAITGGEDRSVRVWDLSSGRQMGAPLVGHTGWVCTVASTVLDGIPIAVTGSRDRSVRVWDLTSRQQIGQPLTGPTSTVCAVATGIVDGRPTVVAGREDGTVQAWDLVTRTRLGTDLTFPYPITSLAIASGGELVVGFDREVAVFTHQ
ncbi:WD40 repeat domain-containing protein (plasmid) [Streptomyces sp. NBC_00289]|uniref:WD40 repeat domain-containing protein n=1 Tax=Streptomyces sp. NBC_00289 TaxID=2975703 RepID=UPI002F90EADE